MDVIPSDVPIFYSFRRCPYAMRARLSLRVSQQRCELREIELRDKPTAMLEASPKATVPVLVLSDGGVIDESLDVMLWALRRHDPERWMQPVGAETRDMLALIALCDSGFKAQLDAYKYARPDRPGDGLAARLAGADYLRDLDARLMAQLNLFGERVSLADMAIVPFVRQFAQVDRVWFDAQPWAGLRRWLDGFLASDQFAQVMKKYAKWQLGAEPVYFGS